MKDSDIDTLSADGAQDTERMTDPRAALAEYQRLMQERERLIAEGVDPRLLIVPLNPDDMPTDPRAALAEAIDAAIYQSEGKMREVAADNASRIYESLAAAGFAVVPKPSFGFGSRVAIDTIRRVRDRLMESDAGHESAWVWPILDNLQAEYDRLAAIGQGEHDR